MFYRCPDCGKKLLRLTEKSTVTDTPIYCPRCKREFFPLIWNGVVYTAVPRKTK